MPLWQAVILGIVQGLTEFLPISSTAHLIIVQQWFGRTDEQLQHDPFTVVIQLGTLFAVFVYFRADIISMTKSLLRDIFHGHVISSTTPESRLAKWILIGSIPAGLAGLFLKSWLKHHFYDAISIAFVSIVFALLMLAAEWWARRLSARRDVEQVGLWDALFIGCFQALALMPGGSRSGCTITAGLFAGLMRPAAARFSFLLSIPIMTAAGIKELYDWLKTLKGNPSLQAAATDQAIALAVGTVVSAAVGYAAIAWLLRFLSKYSMSVFVIYRIALAIGILLLFHAR